MSVELEQKRDDQMQFDSPEMSYRVKFKKRSNILIHKSRMNVSESDGAKAKLPAKLKQ